MDGELAIVLSSIAVACKQIASLVTRAGISNLTGLAGVANIQARTPQIRVEAHITRACSKSSRVPLLIILVRS